MNAYDEQYQIKNQGRGGGKKIHFEKEKENKVK